MSIIIIIKLKIEIKIEERTKELAIAYENKDRRNRKYKVSGIYCLLFNVKNQTCDVVKFAYPWLIKMKHIVALCY